MSAADETTARPAPPVLHELEAKVMREMWRRREATVRAVLDAVNGGAQRPLAYTTILTIMARLHRKGLLERERDGRADVYRAAVTRETYMEARARAEVDALVQRFGDNALVHFARQVQSLDPERRAELRRISERG